MHGHTYQAHAVGCAAVAAVQKIIRKDDLVSNVRAMGELLETRLRESIADHPNVGDIRGRGLFWGIEFVQDKSTKMPFPASQSVAAAIGELALTDRYSIVIYPGSGTADGVNGDHIILAPPYTVTADDVEYIVHTVSRLIDDFFARAVANGHSS